MNDPESCGADRASLRVVEAPLVASLSATRLTVGRGAAAVLDGSGSSDPDAAPTSSTPTTPAGWLGYAWRCAAKSGGGGGGAGTTCLAEGGAPLAFAEGAAQQAAVLQPGVYEITLTVSRGGRSASAAAEVTVLSAPAPVVQMVSAPPQQARACDAFTITHARSLRTTTATLTLILLDAPSSIR